MHTRTIGRVWSIRSCDTFRGKERKISNLAKHPDARRRQPAADTAAFSRRIGQLIESAGSASAFARLCGISESVVRKWRGGQSEPSRAYLERIARRTGASLAWLVSGEGPIYPEDAAPPGQRAAEPTGPGYAILLPGQEAPALADATAGSAQAVGPGAPLMFREDWLQVELGARPQDLYLMRMAGDAMEPVLRAGDLLIVDRRATQPDREGIYVLRMRDLVLVRRLQALPGALVKVSAENPALDSFQLGPADIDGRALAIVGRVVWSGRRL